MSGFRSALFGGLLLGGLASTSTAQDVVPGGWAPQVGFQTFGGPGHAGGFVFVGSGGPTVAPLAPFVGFDDPQAGPMAPWYRPRPQSVNALVPLADAVRRSGRRRPGR
jgi:hypothetical protein